MTGLGLIGDNPAAPPYSAGPYTWDQHVTFTQGVSGLNNPNNIWYVDGNVSSSGDGESWTKAKKTIQEAVTAASAGDTIFIAAIDMDTGATDPGSYEENIIIPPATDGLALIGISRGRTQGGLPQIKDGSTTTSPILTIRSPGCLLMNLGFNGAGNTGGSVVMDDDSSTKTAFGTSIINCHFKNAKSSGAAATGGAISWAATGGAWQVLISGCHFYNCRAGIVLKGTGQSRPQDVVIENCTFMSSAKTTVDADIYLAGGSGVNGLIIRDCVFATVDVPAYAATPDAARYLELTGCTNGVVSNCTFACTGKTFGDGTVNAAEIPTTVRFNNCYQEDAIITRTS